MVAFWKRRTQKMIFSAEVKWLFSSTIEGFSCFFSHGLCKGISLVSRNKNWVLLGIPGRFGAATSPTNGRLGSWEGKKSPEDGRGKLTISTVTKGIITGPSLTISFQFLLPIEYYYRDWTMQKLVCLSGHTLNHSNPLLCEFVTNWTWTILKHWAPSRQWCAYP